MERLNAATPSLRAARAPVVTGPRDADDDRGRRNIVVDPRMQWRAALAVGGVIALTLVLMSFTRAAMASTGVDDPGGERAAHLALVWNVVFVGFVLAVVVTFVLLYTHRVAGPAQVLRRAIEGLCANDFDRRAHVRRGDYLRDLSASVVRLGRKMRRDRELTRLGLDGVARALAEGDPAAAERLLEKFRRERGLAAPPRVEETTMRDEA
jgi:hypothetical protein